MPRNGQNCITQESVRKNKTAYIPDFHVVVPNVMFLKVTVLTGSCKERSKTGWGWVRTKNMVGVGTTQAEKKRPVLFVIIRIGVIVFLVPLIYKPKVWLF